MKKFLFALASLVAVSFAANAEGTRPEVSLSVSQGNPVTEITLNAGETMKIYGNVDYLGGKLVQGVQWNFTMYDENGEMLDNGCHLELLEEYGTHDAWAWFGLNMVGANGTVYNNGTAATSSNGTYHQTDTWDDEGDYMPVNDYGVENVHVTYTGKYNVILANVSANQVFTTRMSYPLQVLEFTVKVEEGWEGQFAELRMEKAEFARPDNDVLNLEGEELPTLKIINGSYVPGVQTLTGEVVFGDVTEDGLLPVSYNGEEEVTIVVTVNGETVQLVEGMVQLAEGTNEVTVVVSAPGYEDLTATTTVEYTVTPPAQTPNPVIDVTPGDDCYIFTAVGEGEVTLWVDGVEVDNPYTVYRTEADQVVKLTAVAHVEGQIDGTVTGEWIVPALEVIPEEPVDLTGEIVIGEVTEDGKVNISYNGDEEGVVITVEGYELDEDGNIQLPDYGTYTITVTVGGEGYNDLTLTQDVEWVEPTPEPQPTATPEILVDVQDEVVIICAQGEGEVLLYIDGEPVTNPVEIARGNEEFTVVATATAQAEDMLISDVATLEVTIPALGGVTPEDPYATGYWVVFFDKNGNPQYHQLLQGDDENGYQTSVALGYKLYGEPANEDAWFNIPFYFLVDGEMYAAPELMTEPVYGDANQNPLAAGENYWCVPVGYKYVVGILFDPDSDDMYMQISKGILVGFDELNAEKTVAGVRYFNMAGQEMSEANGMTIVVTTYTDGTTSAVKVMK